MFPFFALSIIAGSLITTWIYNNSNGSTLMLILWHGALNFVSASKAGEGMPVAVLSTAIMVVAVLLVIIKPKGIKTVSI